MPRVISLLCAFVFISFVAPQPLSAAPTAAEMQARARAIEDSRAAKVEALLKELSGTDEAAREKAATALSKIDRKAFKATPALIEALSRDDTLTRAAVATALGRIGRKASAAVPALSATLSDPDVTVRLSVMYAFYTMGTAAGDAAPSLIGLLDNDDPRVRDAAARTLGRLGEKAALPLAGALQSDQARVRDGALYAIGNLGFHGEAAAPGVMALLNHANPAIREAAAGALERIGDKAAGAVPALIKALNDADGGVRRAAVRALGRFGKKAAEAEDALSKTLARAEADGDTRLHAETAFALSQVGASGDAVLKALLAYVGNDNWDVRARAYAALVRVGTDAMPALFVALRDEPDDLRRNELIEAINTIGPPVPVAAVPVVRELLEHSDDRVRSFAQIVLAHSEGRAPY